jgi:hypothetical protein
VQEGWRVDKTGMLLDGQDRRAGGWTGELDGGWGGHKALGYQGARPCW